jgi:RNA polymerase sigma factor (sigma-70 family)
MGSLTGSRAGTLAAPAVALRLLSDARLVRLASAGSEVAFAAIFERYHQALYRYCHSILGNGHDAADALQNTMLSALRALPGETREILLRAWLYRIAHNESISLLRTRRADSDLQSAAHVSDLAAEGIVESRERLRALTADLQQLTEQQRGALLLRELGELQFSDIACTLQISAAAAKQSVYEARCALQAMEQGRAMDCDVVRRALSDGDRRTLRAKKMRGHLRACAGCQAFQAASGQRPAHLTALVPPLPPAMTAAMLHGVLGGGGSGLLAGLGASVTTGSAFSLGAVKAATVVLVAGSVAGGAAYVAPSGQAVRPVPSTLTRGVATHDARSVAVSLTAARDHDDVFSPRSHESPRKHSTTETSVTTAATTVDRTHGVTAQQRAGAAPSRTTTDTAPPSTATAGHATVPDDAVTGDGLKPRPTQTSKAATPDGNSAPRATKPAHPAKPAADPTIPAAKPAHPAKPAADPATPAKPTHPAKPAADPTIPAAKPAHPAKPAANPATPAKPTHPAKPVHPAATPATPAKKSASTTSPAPVIPTASAAPKRAWL